MTIAKPLVKWIGGKRQLLPQLKARMPYSYNNYYEPFVGGGALFYELIQNDNKRGFSISDLNETLINMYKIVRDHPIELIEHLKRHKSKHNKEYYYKIRSMHNLTSVKNASRFLYLNKTCFNGLYRVNSKGEFNVPIGKYKNPNIVQEDNIHANNRILQNVNIKSQFFDKITPQKNDFVYFDPPYYPLNKTSNFTNYTNMGFDETMQTNLKIFMDKLDKKDVLFMLSNSNTEYTRELYKNYNIDTIQANRAINSNGDKRGKVSELIVRNY